jgi:hypothetical protein
MNNQQILTMDPYMLLSIVNMKLRDSFDSLEGMCEEYGLEAEILEKRLSAVGYNYNKGNNQFIAIL